MSADLDLVLNKIDQMPQADLRVLMELVFKKLGLQNSDNQELSLSEYIELQEELTKELAEMSQWNDKALWKAARNSHLSAKEANKLQSLQHKREFKPLTQAEVELKNKLLEKYENSMVIRAEAIVLLQKRGFDISSLRKTR